MAVCPSMRDTFIEGYREVSTYHLGDALGVEPDHGQAVMLPDAGLLRFQGPVVTTGGQSWPVLPQARGYGWYEASQRPVFAVSDPDGGGIDPPVVFSLPDGTTVSPQFSSRFSVAFNRCFTSPCNGCSGFENSGHLRSRLWPQMEMTRPCSRSMPSRQCCITSSRSDRLATPFLHHFACNCMHLREGLGLAK